MRRGEGGGGGGGSVERVGRRQGRGGRARGSRVAIRHAIQLLATPPRRSAWTGSPNRATISARRSSAMSSHAPARPGASTGAAARPAASARRAAARAARRERPCRRLDEPAARHAPDLGREGRAPRRVDVLDHARAVGEVEGAVVEGQALGRVGPHERPGVVRARREVDARDVEPGLEPAQAQGPAADVDDPHARLEAREREEAPVAAGRGRGRPGQRPGAHARARARWRRRPAELPSTAR